MKKWQKRGLIILGALVLVIGGTMGVMQYRISQELALMHPLDTQVLPNEIVVIRDSFVNLYLVRSKDGYIAFDAGNDTATVANELNNLKIDPLSVKAIFLSHTDTDHVVAISLFKNAIVYISRLEEQMIDGRIHRLLIFNNSLPGAYSQLDDGQVLDVDGVQVQAIVTPGHTPGSTCYVVNGVNLFTGDAFGLKNGIAGQYNELFNMDTKTALISQEKLKGLTGIQSIYTAHHGLTNDIAKAFGLK